MIAQIDRPVGLFGRAPMKTDPRNFQLRDYFAPELPAPLPTYGSLPQVFSKLGGSIVDVPALFPMDGNDRYGDCTIAGLAHLITLSAGLVGSRQIMTAEAVQNLYLQLSGGKDNGLACLDVLNYWRKNQPMPGQAILGYLQVDVKNQTEVEQAIDLFGNLYIGFNVTQRTMQEFRNHQPWTAAPVIPGEGHCVVLTDHTPSGGDRILTWGNSQPWTWAWFRGCVEEAYVVVPPQAMIPGFNPNWNYAQLAADFAALGGSGLPPAVTPEPVPSTPFVVGPDILFAMGSQQDEPSTSEVYFKSPDGVDQYSEAQGKSGWFYRFNAWNRTVSAYPANRVFPARH